MLTVAEHSGDGPRAPAGHPGGGTNWWSYDDPTVVAQKTAYVKQKELGGVMVWELDGDDGTLTTAVDTGLR